MAPQDFSFGKAVFHFFSIAGKRPTAALWIALWQAVLTGALVYLAFVTIGDFYFWLIGQIASGVEPNATELLSRLGGAIAFGPLISIGGILISLMAQAAWLRLLTRDEVAPVIPFRIGGDELRLFVTNVGLMAIGMLFYFATSLIVGIVVGVGIAAAVAGDGSVGAGMAGGLFVGLFIIALVLAAIFVAVRLSAAPATTVLEKRIAFPAWGATRGVFWPVLGSYIVAAIIIFILSSIIGTIVNFAFLGAFMPLLGQFIDMAQAGTEPDPQQVLAMIESQLRSAGTATTLAAAGLLMVILRAFTDAIWHGVGAYVARTNQPAVPDLE
jgi:hypothetical protein